MTQRIDLNFDGGEGGGNDEALMALASSVNIACGGHAGDATTMARTVGEAIKRGVSIGVHPGFADRASFGRGETANADPDEVYALTLGQISALAAFASAQGKTLSHVKPHGALYHRAEREEKVACAIVQAARDFDARLIVYAFAGGTLAGVGRGAGMTVAGEIFADRAYQANGTLCPRSEPNAVLRDPEAAARQTLRLLAERGAEAHTICVHGDEPTALAVARAVRDALEAAGFVIRPPDAP